MQPHTWHGPPEGFALWNIARRVQGGKFGEFIELWMEQPREVREKLSYSGALRSSVGDPVHYV